MNAAQALKAEADRKRQAEHDAKEKAKQDKELLARYTQECIENLPKTRAEVDTAIKEAIEDGKKAITYEAGGIPLPARKLLVAWLKKDAFEVTEYQQHGTWDASDECRNLEYHHYNLRISWVADSPELKQALADEYLHQHIFLSFEGGTHLSCGHCKQRVELFDNEDRVRFHSKMPYRTRFIRTLIEEGYELDCRYCR